MSRRGGDSATRAGGARPLTRVALRALGSLKLLATLLPENRSAWNTPSSVGYRPIGWIGYVGLGPWRRHSHRLAPAATRG